MVYLHIDEEISAASDRMLIAVIRMDTRIGYKSRSIWFTYILMKRFLLHRSYVC